MFCLFYFFARVSLSVRWLLGRYYYELFLLWVDCERKTLSGETICFICNVIRRIIEIVFTRFLRFHDCLSHNKSQSECRPKTVALLTSNALIICHGTFHIFMKGKMNELQHTRVMLLTYFLSTVHSFFWWGTHKRCSREEPPNCSYTFLRLQDLLVFFTFFSTFNGDSFVNFIFSLPLLFINSWHNSFFYILANGTTNELFSIHKPLHFDFYFANFKGFFSIQIVFFSGAKISIRSVPNSKT